MDNKDSENLDVIIPKKKEEIEEENEIDEETAENIKKIMEETNEMTDEEAEEIIVEEDIKKEEAEDKKEDSDNDKEDSELKEDTMEEKNYSFCGNCGNRIENGSKFCENCGSEVKKNEPTLEESKVEEVNSSFEPSSTDVNNKSYKTGRFIIMFILILVVFIVLLVFLDSSSSKDDKERKYEDFNTTESSETMMSVPATEGIEEDSDEAAIKFNLSASPIFDGYYKRNEGKDAYSGKTVYAKNMNSDALFEYVANNPGSMQNYEFDSSLSFEFEGSTHSGSEYNTIYLVSDFENQVNKYFGVNATLKNLEINIGNLIIDTTGKYVAVYYFADMDKGFEKVSTVLNYDLDNDTYTVYEKAVFVNCVVNNGDVNKSVCTVYDTSSKTNSLGSFDYDASPDSFYSEWEELSQKVDLSSAKTFVSKVDHNDGAYVWISTSVQ